MPPAKVIVRRLVIVLAVVLLLPPLLLVGIGVLVRERTPIEPPADVVGDVGRLEIVDSRRLVTSIDVFVTTPASREAVRDLAHALVTAAETDPSFVAAAVLDGLAAEDQPLHELGFVPTGEAWVAIYGQWRADGHRQGFTGTSRGRALLGELAPLAPWAAAMLDDPLASLYQPTLIDATGELCDHEVCEAGTGVGPILDEADPRASFINVFETTPDRQHALLETTYGIMPTARTHAGYLRTALHRSLDGKRVANVGQYETYRQIADMYYHLRTVLAFGQVFVKDVTTPLLCLGVCIGDYPRLRTYTVRDVVTAANVPRTQG